MHINKPTVTKIEAADSVILLHIVVLATGFNSTNLENLVKCLYPCPDICHFMIVTKKTLAFRRRNYTLDNFI